MSHDYNDIDPEFGWSIGGMFKSAGNFVSGAVKTAGREIGKVDDHLGNVAKTVNKTLKKVPVVGAPLNTVFDVAYTAVTGPMVMTAQVVEGKRIDKVAMGHLRKTASNAKAIAPYAQTVVSVVPGIGPGVSAALGAGIALASGQPLDKIAQAAIKGAIPGGPLAAAAFDVASEGVRAAATGKKFNVGDAVTTAAGSGLQALGLPKEATTALAAGVDAAGKIAGGQPLDKALTSAAVQALPIDRNAKAALNEATDLSIALAKGQRVDRALLQRVDRVAKYLPVDSKTKEQLATAARTGKSIVQGRPLEKSLATALQGAVGDSLITQTTKNLPKTARNAIQTGLATGSAVVQQHARAAGLDKVPNKLAEAGKQSARSLPIIGAARKMVKDGSKGFDVATGLLAHPLNAFDVVHVREKLAPKDKLGFDTAVALHTGMVTRPIAKQLGPTAQAGNAIALGSKGMPKGNQKVLIANVEKSANARVGIQKAVKTLAKEKSKTINPNANIIARVFYTLGFR